MLICFFPIRRDTLVSIENALGITLLTRTPGAVGGGPYRGGGSDDDDDEVDSS